LNEFAGKDDIIYISASSVGSINAYAYAADKLEYAEKIWLSQKSAGVRSLIRTFMRTPYVFDAVDSFVGEGDSLKSSCLYVTCFNMTKLALNYINLQEVEPTEIKEYLKACVAVPIFSKTVEISGAKYLDGALIDNIPILPLMKYHLDYIIVVHFDNSSYTFENEYFDNKLIKINFLDDKIIKNSLSFDPQSVNFMLKSGYEQSKSLFEIIFKNGTNDLDYIYEKIIFLKAIHPDRQLRITSDTVVNNINKFLKKVVQKKI